MAEEASFPAGHRLSDDLRRIREARDVSIDEIHTETRIARTLIESFEEGALYDHPTYNRVYLRSFLKAYADVIEMPRDRTLRALDAALEGAYQHELAREYLSGEGSGAKKGEAESRSDDETTRPPSSSSPSTRSEEPTAGGPEGRGGIVGPPRAVGEEPEQAEIPMDNPPDDAATKGSPSPSPEESDEAPDGETDADAAEAPTAADKAEEEKPDDETEASSAEMDPAPEDKGTEEAQAEEETPTEAPTADDEAEDSGERDVSDMTGPEALRSTPEEDSDAESDDWSGSAWRDEDPSDEVSTDPDRPESAPSAPASMEGEVGSGIVGTPTEKGSGEPGTPSASAPPPRGRDAPASSSGSGVADLFEGANRRIAITSVGIAVVLLVLVGLGMAYFSSGSEDADPASADTAATATSPAAPDTSVATAADTVADTTAPSTQQRPPPADVTLSNTIFLQVLATDNVSRLRVQRDDDLRRPYWIEEGEAAVFPFQRRAIIGREFEDIRLFIDGYEYPFSPADTIDGLNLTRETLQAFVDTLRGTPTVPDVPRDTFPVGPLEDTTPAPDADRTVVDTSSG
ncbi:MAG: hypothetical protein BRD55_09080 [Bacteroidetes bacterium SW_9_63_38]|nr:MAG: hypothetical protein BRD55_09080 [Bacteroidetes bacterium SW_9_63_38]